MSMITKLVKELRNEAELLKYFNASRLLQKAADTLEMLAAKVRKENRTEEAKDRQENTIDKILTLIDAEVWSYIDYLKKQEKISGDLGDHISCLSENIRERLREELPGILSDEYEKAFMDGFENHPTYNAYQKAFEDIRAEISDMSRDFNLDEVDDWNSKSLACIIGRCSKWANRIIDKHDPSKAGKETE